MSGTASAGLPRRLRIGLFVQGRFHAFDLARALIERGHVVRLLTNYPKWAIRRFGLTDQNIETNVAHGIASKIADRVHRFLPGFDLNPALNRWFGTWAARKLKNGSFDVVHGFTQVAEEPLRRVSAPVRTVVRGSAHIRTQAAILATEQNRLGSALGVPSTWSIAREEREYTLADSIVVLSSFAYRSFVEQGTRPERIRLLRLGVDTRGFRPDAGVLADRTRRILSGEPLRLLMVGTFSAQKGAHDFRDIVCQLPPSGFLFRFVGAVEPEVAAIAKQLRDRVDFVPRQMQSALPAQYAWGDLFLFPTLQDGFAVVLSQAQAACLPVLTTTNSSGPDLIVDGKTGWVLPIRDSESFVRRIRWCSDNRDAVAGMVAYLDAHHVTRDWKEVAADFEALMYDLMQARRSEAPV
ncbi:MAG: glycosyltransferase family 4 protein [Acidobacteriaceae bacterium]|nr:glycosyltransferase family 4 protein [Acidobacteriaceae bacterium]